MTKIAVILAVLVPAVATANFDDKMSNLLLPVVRVTYGDSGGSGTVIYSDDRDEEGRYFSAVLTNHHVISDAISIEKKWNSLKGRYENVEVRKRVKVEAFIYDSGNVVATQDYYAEIVAHSEDHDLAVLRLCFPHRIENVAPLQPEGEELYLFQNVYAVGCSLLHEPIATFGHITDLEDIIDGVPYCMTTANIIFGNSGGSVFTDIDGTWYLVGVPSRIAVSRGSPITHMAWFIPLDRIRSWIQEQILDFLIDERRTPKQCFDERAKLLSPSATSEPNKGNLSPYDYIPRGGIRPEKAIVEPDPDKGPKVD